MTDFRHLLFACGLSWASAGDLYLATPAHAAGGLPPAVKQDVVAAVAHWSRSGDIGRTGAAIADLCNENPGVALDIVGYAGEAAVSGQLPQRCLMAGSTCEELEQLLALLLAHAMRLTGDRIVASLPSAVDVAPPAEIFTPPVAGDADEHSGPPPADQIAGTSPDAGGEPDDDPGGAPPHDGGNSGGGRPPGESTGGAPCQAGGTCGGEPPPASYTAL